MRTLYSKLTINWERNRSSYSQFHSTSFYEMIRKVTIYPPPSFGLNLFVCVIRVLGKGIPYHLSLSTYLSSKVCVLEP